MDPISIAIEIELGALLLAVVGGVATWMNHRHQKAVRRQRERHHREVHSCRGNSTASTSPSYAPRQK